MYLFLQFFMILKYLNMGAQVCWFFFIMSLKKLLTQMVTHSILQTEIKPQEKAKLNL